MSGLLAVGLVASLLAGCGGSAAAPAAGSSPATKSAAGSGAAPATPSAKSVFPQGVTIVVGFASGGTVDTSARIIQPYLQKALGVPVVVQNMPGAGGITAGHYVFTQKADAPVLLMTFLPALTIGQVIGKGSYNEQQLTPVFGVFGHDTIVILAKKGSPFKDFASLKAATKAITAGVAGVKSSTSWAALAELSQINGIHMVAVPFNGGAPATDAAMGGSIDLAATTLVEAVRLVGSGKAQAVLQFASGPVPQLPGVESIAKVGKPSEALDTVLGLTGPQHMPAAEVQVLAAALNKVVKNPAFIAKAKNVGLQVQAQQPSAWGQSLTRSYSSIQKEAPLLLKFGSK